MAGEHSEEIEELCDQCEGITLIRISEEDPDNHHDGDAVVCPACLDLKRVE